MGAVRVYVSAPDQLSTTECDVLSEILAAKLEQHLADRARYLPTHPGRAAQPGDAGSPSGTKPALSTDDDRDAQPDDFTWPDGDPRANVPKRTGAPITPRVAWDLTLRCNVCNSNVERWDDGYHCDACERRNGWWG